MTRIFEAFRKSRAAASPPALEPPPAPPAVPARRGSAIGHVFGSVVPHAEPPGAAGAPIRGYPLVAAGALEDDVVQQMTALRISLESALPEPRRRVVMILGSQRREGATTVALQLARTLARDERQRVSFLDAHAGHPGLEVDPARHVAVPRTVDSSAPADGGPMANLEAWPVPPGPLSPGTMREMIETLGADAKWVIVDGPPVLESAEAAALAASVDGVILVVQSGRTKRPVLTRSVELLRKAGARVLGTVLNRRRLEIPEFIYRRI